MCLETNILNTTENDNILKIQFIFHVDRSSQCDQFSACVIIYQNKFPQDSFPSTLKILVLQYTQIKLLKITSLNLEESVASLSCYIY